MLIHVVKPGNTVYSIALEYGIPMSQLILDNGLETSSRLAVGQALVVQFPTQTHTVQPGETLASIAAAYQLPLRQLYRNNPILGGIPELYPGQTLVLAYDSTPEATLSVNGYAYPFIDPALLQSTVPYLTYLTPFTYGFTPDGTLVDLDDGVLIAMSAPVVHKDDSLALQPDLRPGLGAGLYLAEHFSVNRPDLHFAAEHRGGKRNFHRGINVLPFAAVTRFLRDPDLEHQVAGLSRPRSSLAFQPDALSGLDARRNIYLKGPHLPSAVL